MAREDYVMKDLAGYPFNSKYPPDKSNHDNLYHGYKSDVEETLFYDFAVQGYDLRFTYKGTTYHFLSEPDYVAYCDEKYTDEYLRFPDGNTALEQFTIDGKSIIELIAELEDVEPIQDIPGAKRPSYSIVYDAEDLTQFFTEISIIEENGIQYLKALFKGKKTICERILKLDAERYRKGDLPLGNLLSKYCSYIAANGREQQNKLINQKSSDGKNSQVHQERVTALV